MDKDERRPAKESLYLQIGAATIQDVITEFYRRAFTDPIIGFFFFNKDLDEITAKQTDFATAMLGGPKCYKGRPLAPVHALLPIRPAHFGRRQVLMREVLDETRLASDLKEAWLRLEESLKPLILGDGDPSCVPQIRSQKVK